MFGWSEVVWYSIFLGLAIKGTAVLGAAWLLAFLLRRRSAAARHLVWTAAAAAVLALPLLSISLPALRIPAGATLLPLSPEIVFSATNPATRGNAAGQTVAYRSAIPSLNTAPSRVHWASWLMWLWIAGAAAGIAQMLMACAAIWRVRRSAQPSSDRELCGALARGLGIHHKVDVLQTDAGSMPMTFGVLRSFICLPSNSAEWSGERRRVVLLHELAHVRRSDVTTHLLARTALVLYWWNPLAWTAWRAFLQERERAADDLVLNSGARPSEYANHLLEVARTMQSPRAMEWAAVAMVRRSQLETRLRAILDSGVDRKAPARPWAIAAALLALGLVAPLAAVRAQPSETHASQSGAIPADADAAIRAARSQRNFEILETAANSARQMREYDTAQKLLQSSAAIRAEVYGPQSVEYGIELLKLAELEQKAHHKLDEAGYTQAAQLLGERPEAARAYISLGVTALSKMDFPQAIEYFQHARRVDPTRAGTAVTWMAVVRQRERNMEEAGALYQSALSLEDPKSTEAVPTRKLYAAFLREQARGDEAAELETSNRAIQSANAAQVQSPSGSGASAGVYRIGGGVTSPSVLNKVEPTYSEEARVAKLTGTEVLYVEIGPDGLAHNAKVIQGLGLGLDENGIDAVSQWRFQPGTREGQPVTVSATIEINWRLQ